MPSLEETIIQIMDWDPYLARRHAQRFVNRIACPSGVVVIDYVICRGIEPCPICGQMTGMGVVRVQHHDGRSAAFHPRLYHYVDAQHPITEKDVDGQLLLAIMADAQDRSSGSYESQNNLARLEMEAFYLGVLTARELKPLSRLEYVVTGDILNAMFQHLDLTVTSVTRVAQNGERVGHWILARGYLIVQR